MRREQQRGCREQGTGDRAPGRLAHDRPSVKVHRPWTVGYRPSIVRHSPAALRSKSPWEGGFTVLELLAATAILLVLSGLLLTLFSRASDAWRLGQQGVDRQRAARLTLELISRDLSQAFISTSTPPINFFGFSNSAYFIAIVPSQVGRESDMGEIGYRLDASSGKLYRYYTEPTANNAAWNPRDDGSGTAWKWNQVTNAANFQYSSEADTLVAEGIVDLQFAYYNYTNNVPYDGWTTTTPPVLPATVLVTNILPTVVDVFITTIPAVKWKAPGSPGYDNLTNQYSRTFQTSVHLTRGGY